MRIEREKRFMTRNIRKFNSVVGPVFVAAASVKSGDMHQFETYARETGLDRRLTPYPTASLWGKYSERTLIFYANEDRLFVSSASKQTVERLLDEILAQYLKETDLATEEMLANDLTRFNSLDPRRN